jgi:hypothetical protein
MNDEYFEFQLESRRYKARSKVNAGRFGTLRPSLYQAETGFKCGRCHVFITAEPVLSGVNNRNHCPYCLWSKHLDLYQAGDRLAACKSLMRPVGLALKRTRKKYEASAGELMLVHLCVECERVSVNRMAADDDAARVWEIYTASCEKSGQAWPADGQVSMLDASVARLVRARLFGNL